MATVSKERMREVLEEAMEDVAMLMADGMNYQQKLLELRQRCAEMWGMADLGEVPAFEPEVRILGARRHAS